MAVFKCKMCGATLEVENIDNIVQCEYCKSQQKNPDYPIEQKLTSEIKSNAADLYTYAMNMKRDARKIKNVEKARRAQEIFNSISGYLDASFQADECGQLAEDFSVE